MDTDKTFYTATLANLLTRQGKYREAARVYRHLLKQNPERADLRHALQRISPHLKDQPRQWERLEALIGQWVRLVLGQRKLTLLRHIQVKNRRS